MKIYLRSITRFSCYKIKLIDITMVQTISLKKNEIVGIQHGFG